MKIDTSEIPQSQLNPQEYRNSLEHTVDGNKVVVRSMEQDGPGKIEVGSEVVP